MPQLQSIARERQDLSQLLKYWKTVSGGMVSGFTIIPIGGFLSEPLLPSILRLLGPPFGVFVTVVVIIFLYYSNRNRDVAVIDKKARRLFAFGMAAVVMFAWCWFAWVINVDGDWHISGLTLTNEARKALEDGMIVSETPKILLDRMGHDSLDRIWWGRAFVKLLLLVSFVGTFALIAGSFFLFTLQNLMQDRIVNAPDP